MIKEFNELELLKIGNELEIVGVVYGDSNERIIILVPDESKVLPFTVMTPTLEEWQQIVRQSDLKEVELVGDSKDKKIILRKSTRQIEQHVMWEVFRRDKYTCRYCGNNKVPLTIDHMVLWEEGGPSISVNLITSCKKCNNLRGSMQYEDWLESPEYMERQMELPLDIVARNLSVRDLIPHIREHHMRKMKRSR